MGTLGFIWAAPRRRPKLAATLFVLVASIGMSAGMALSRIHDARALVAIGSVLGAVVVSFLGSAAMDWRGGLITESWQLRTQLKVDVLAEFDAALMQRIRAELVEGQPAGQQAAAVAPSQALVWVPPTAVGVEPPVGMASAEQFEGFRELRTRLLTAAAGIHTMPFTTLVVPLVAGSGGSFVARNLAASFALQDDTSVLLVDCNFAHPSQHVALRTGEDGGLFDFLDGPQVRLAPKVTPVRGLHLIPCGRPRSQYREYFSSGRMRDLIYFLRESGSFVVLDGPPAKGSQGARTLSEMADFVVLVVGSGMARAGDIRQAVAMFEPAKLAGVVFNERS